MERLVEKCMHGLFVMVLMLLTCAHHANGQEITDKEINEIVATGRGYTMVFLKKGPNYGVSSSDSGKVQMEHLKYLFTLKQQGYLPLFGPFEGKGELRGICISVLTDTVKLKQLFDNDPHVKAGNLTYELKPWFGIPGDSLPE